MEGPHLLWQSISALSDGKIKNKKAGFIILLRQWFWGPVRRLVAKKKQNQKNPKQKNNPPHPTPRHTQTNKQTKNSVAKLFLSLSVVQINAKPALLFIYLLLLLFLRLKGKPLHAVRGQQKWSWWQAAQQWALALPLSEVSKSLPVNKQTSPKAPPASAFALLPWSVLSIRNLMEKRGCNMHSTGGEETVWLPWKYLKICAVYNLQCAVEFNALHTIARPG